jgi:hypothetical protein
MNDNTKNILKGLAIGFGIIGAIAGAVYLYRRSGGNSSKSESQGKSIIIGDSQTPFIAKQSQKAKMLGDVGSESNLWLGGKGLSWLKTAVSKYPVSNDVSNVVINIGTNGGFTKHDDIKGLVSELKRVFPKAKLFAVKGSWGWGGNANTTEDTVNYYYNLFKQEGVTIINPPIGSVSDPHGNLPVYVQIGKSIDSLVS